MGEGSVTTAIDLTSTNGRAAAEIVVRGKCCRQDRLPLPYDVGEALAPHPRGQVDLAVTNNGAVGDLTPLIAVPSRGARRPPPIGRSAPGSTPAAPCPSCCGES